MRPIDRPGSSFQAEIAGAEEKARAEEAIKRSIVERHRVRLTVALAASVLGLVALGGGGWSWVVQQRAGRRAETDRVVAEALEKATLLRGQARASAVGDLSKWDEARIAGDQAPASMKAGEPSAATRALVGLVLAEIDRDRKFLDRLERIRLDPRRGEKPGEVDAACATAFREFGVDVERLEPVEAGRLLSGRSDAPEIALFLDDWTRLRRPYLRLMRDAERRDSWRRMVAVARATDRDPWRDDLRKLIDGGTYEAVRQWAVDQSALASQPARSRCFLAQVLELNRGEDPGRSSRISIDILERAWRLSPDDFQMAHDGFQGGGKS